MTRPIELDLEKARPRDDLSVGYSGSALGAPAYNVMIRVS